MFWIDSEKSMMLKRILCSQPMAIAYVKGDDAHSSIRGIVSFHPAFGGTLLSVDISGLPVESGNCKGKFFAVHIHEGTECRGNASDPFASAGMHYNPHNCEHPMHAGDLTPIFSTDGFAWGALYTQNFTVPEIIGKTLIIHAQPDDFKTQPSGNSDGKIACGVIESVMRY